ncbi:TPA: hypothetical protein MH595_13750 [Klebsiella pneumoniae]|nr:hypothetical protein F8D02_03910 [Klebsiella pneumoniae]MBK2932133.1 hypothetical protein [Klebsiella pneumoniae]MCQ4029020.1 hypothetical protein [Klebsiella pneumoniae]PXG20077.1 hypothetical protein DMP58_23205 [Klebsiella pneumoniae]TMY07592.1 hypothetical protein EMH04_03075 [Klebsiella pneumoniae]
MSCDADKSALRQNLWARWSAGFCIFRVYFSITTFIIRDVGKLKGEEEIAASLAIKYGRSGNKLAGR